MSLTLERPEISSSTQCPRPKWQRGLMCLATFCVAPFGWFCPNRFFGCLSEDRFDKGLVLILPGIEGRSFLNMAILHGLMDAGLSYAMEVVDWTTGNKFLTLYHLRAWRRNQRVAQELAQRIVDYQRDYPGRPVWIVGHSGGGGLALLIARALPDDRRLTGLILLAAAISPRFDVSSALKKVERGVWSFHSWLDCLFVGVGTTIFGTFDGWHMPAAGMLGFFRSSKWEECPSKIVQTRYHPRMISGFNLGGHFGCAHRVFIAEHVGKIIQDQARVEASHYVS